MIPILQDIGNSSDIHAIDGEHASIYSTTSSRSAQDADTEEVTGHNAIGLNKHTILDARNWSSVNRPASVQQNDRYGPFSGDLIDSLTCQPSESTATMKMQYQIPAIGLMPSSEKGSRQTGVDAARAMSDGDSAGIASPEGLRLPPRSATLDASTSDISRPTLAQQASPSSSQIRSFAYPYPPLLTAGGRDVVGNSVLGAYIAPGYRSNEHATASSVNGLETLTPLSRVYFNNSMHAPPPQICHEYSTSVNTFVAACTRSMVYNQKIAQHKSDTAVLKGRVEEAAATAVAQELRITEDHARLSQASPSLYEIPNLSARRAALHAATEQVIAAQEKIEEVKARLAEEIEPLRRQLASLEEEIKSEKESVAQAGRERDAAGKRKLEIENEFGCQLAFLLGKELERGVKRLRGE